MVAKLAITEKQDKKENENGKIPITSYHAAAAWLTRSSSESAWKDLHSTSSSRVAESSTNRSSLQVLLYVSGGRTGPSAHVHNLEASRVTVIFPTPSNTTCLHSFVYNAVQGMPRGPLCRSVIGNKMFAVCTPLASLQVRASDTPCFLHARLLASSPSYS